MLVTYFKQLSSASCYVCPTTIFLQFQFGILYENNNVKVEDVHGWCWGLVDLLKLIPNNIGSICRFSLKLNISISCFLVSFHTESFVACITLFLKFVAYSKLLGIVGFWVFVALSFVRCNIQMIRIKLWSIIMGSKKNVVKRAKEKRPR